MYVLALVRLARFSFSATQIQKMKIVLKRFLLSDMFSKTLKYSSNLCTFMFYNFFVSTLFIFCKMRLICVKYLILIV